MTVSEPTEAEQALLDVRDLEVSFRLSGGRRLQAVRQVNLQIRTGQTLAVVGESGSGKSTTARAVLRLLKEATGSVRLAGHELMDLRGASLRRARRHAAGHAKRHHQH